MERFTETDCSKCGVPVNVDLDPQGDLVRYDDAQRALDAEREKVAKLEKIQAIDLKNNNEYREQLATLQAQLRQVEGELADEKTAYKKLSEQWNKTSIDLADTEGKEHT